MKPQSSVLARHDFLDLAKGIGIILVIAGHTIQERAPDFDDSLLFRIIYSFHMPLFVFLSGAVVSLWYDPGVIAKGIGKTWASFRSRVGRAAVRLLLPFIAWTVVNSFLFKDSSSIFSDLILAFRRPDTSLWFLLCIFYCIFLFCLIQLIYAAVLAALSRLGILSNKTQGMAKSSQWQLISIFFIWLILKNYSSHAAGLGLLKIYFNYFVFGIWFYKCIYPIRLGVGQVILYLVFAISVTYWHRASVDHILPNTYAFFQNPFVRWTFSSFVAIIGILVIIDITNKLLSIKPKFIYPFLILCGKLSLGIYVIHHYFLNVSPPIIAALLLSILISWLILKIPIAKTVLLGE